MIKIFGENQELWQWDLDRRIVVGVDCVEIHFANALQSDALGVEIYEQDGQRFANVPNCLLQVAVPLIVYAEEAGGRTRCAYCFEIRPRAKPADYVYTETEVRTVEGYVYQALEKAKENGDFKGETGASGVYYGNDEPGEEYDVWIIPGSGEPVARGIDANGNEAEYSSVSLALIDSVSVTMIADSTESVITVPSGVTLDLNGHTLTADYVTSFGDVIDSSPRKSKTGLLVIDKENLTVRTNNSMFPVYNGADGFYFAEVTINSSLNTTENTNGGVTYSIDWKPSFGESKITQILKDNGSQDNYFSFIFAYEYLNNGVKTFSEQQFTESTIINVYGNNKIFTNSITFNSIPEYLILSISIKSESGATVKKNVLDVSE